jgi:hypothetical protein
MMISVRTTDNKIPPKKYPTLEGIKNILESLAETDPKAKAAKPEDFVYTRGRSVSAPPSLFTKCRRAPSSKPNEVRASDQLENGEADRFAIPPEVLARANRLLK